jgi:hypothetical protein
MARNRAQTCSRRRIPEGEDIIDGRCFMRDGVSGGRRAMGRPEMPGKTGHWNRVRSSEVQRNQWTGQRALAYHHEALFILIKNGHERKQAGRRGGTHPANLRPCDV